MKSKMLQYDFLLDPYSRTTHQLNLISQTNQSLKINRIRITTNAEIEPPQGPLSDNWGNVRKSLTKDGLHYVYDLNIPTGKTLELKAGQPLVALRYNFNGALGPLKDATGAVAMAPTQIEIAVDDQALQTISLIGSDITPPDPHPKHTQNYYLANWGQYTTHKTADDIHFGENNRLTYAFIGFNKKTGKVESLDSWGDQLELPKLNLAKQRFPYLKLNLAFGGWTNKGIRMDTEFSEMAANPTVRKNFVSSAVDAVIQANADGIDIDWEYVKKADAEDFVLLMQELRAELKERVGAHAQLTIAAPAGKENIEALTKQQWQAVAAVVDVISIMTYDYFGSFSSINDFHSAWELDPNSPHAKASGEAPYFCIKKTLSLYEEMGLEKKQLAIGIPNYCRGVIVNELGQHEGLYQSVQGAPEGENGAEGGIYSWDAILKKLRNQPSPLDQLNVRQWIYHGPEDPLCNKADMCLLVGLLPDNRYAVFNFVDPNGAYRRAFYAAENGYAGAMVWANYNDTVKLEDSFAKAISCGLEKQYYDFSTKPKVHVAHYAKVIISDDRKQLISEINTHIADLDTSEKRNRIISRVLKFFAGLIPTAGILSPLKQVVVEAADKLLAVDSDKNKAKMKALETVLHCHVSEDAESIINVSKNVLNQHRNPLKRFLVSILPTSWTSSKKWFQTESLQLAIRFKRNLPIETTQVVDSADPYPYRGVLPPSEPYPGNTIQPLAYSPPVESSRVKENSSVMHLNSPARFFVNKSREKEGPHHTGIELGHKHKYGKQCTRG